jgi:hypothetical protein
LPLAVAISRWKRSSKCQCSVSLCSPPFERGDCRRRRRIHLGVGDLADGQRDRFALEHLARAHAVEVLLGAQRCARRIGTRVAPHQQALRPPGRTSASRIGVREMRRSSASRASSSGLPPARS